MVSTIFLKKILLEKIFLLRKIIDSRTYSVDIRYTYILYSIKYIAKEYRDTYHRYTYVQTTMQFQRVYKICLTSIYAIYS